MLALGANPIYLPVDFFLLHLPLFEIRANQPQPLDPTQTLTSSLSPNLLSPTPRRRPLVRCVATAARAPRAAPSPRAAPPPPAPLTLPSPTPPRAAPRSCTAVARAAPRPRTAAACAPVRCLAAAAACCPAPRAARAGAGEEDAPVAGERCPIQLLILVFFNIP